MTKKNKAQPEDDAETATGKPKVQRASRGGGKAASGTPASPGKAPKRTRAKGKPDKLGKVVAIGLDVPTLDAAIEAERGPGAGRPEDYHSRFAEIAR
jgi:hypothetical protein